MNNKPEYMTMRYLLELLKKQQGDNYEKALDMPLCIGVSDGNRNFDYCEIFRDYPHYREPYDEFKGMVRIDCHTTRKRLVEVRKKK